MLRKRFQWGGNWVRTAALAALVMLPAVGCSSNGASHGDASPDAAAADGRHNEDRVDAMRHLSSEEYEEGLSTQDAIISGGQVSAEIYMNAVQQGVECVTDTGLVVDGPVWSPVDSITYYYAIWIDDRSEAEFDAITWDCQFAYWDKVGRAYRQDREPQMADDLLASVQACLQPEGVLANGDEQSLNELLALDLDRHETVLECVGAGIADLYPELPPQAMEW